MKKPPEKLTKFISLTLILTILLLSLSACGEKAEAPSGSNDQTAELQADLTESQYAFYLLIKDNPLDKAYKAEQTGSTTKELVELENKYAVIWNNELYYSIKYLKAELGDSNKEKFEESQESWQEYLNNKYGLISDMLVDNGLKQNLGSAFEIEIAQSYKQEIRERVLYLKYLLYCIECSNPDVTVKFICEPEDFAPNENENYEVHEHENGFNYIIKNGEITIVERDYIDKEIIVIPESIDGYPVTELACSFYRYTAKSLVLPESLKRITSGFYRFGIEELYIPKNVEYICDGLFFKCNPFKILKIDPENQYYTVVNNVLYTKDMKTLVYYPENNPEKTFEIPDTVTEIQSGAFGYTPNYLEKLIIPAGVVIFPESELFQVKDRTTLVIEKGSPAEKYARLYEMKYKYAE